MANIYQAQDRENNENKSSYSNLYKSSLRSSSSIEYQTSNYIGDKNNIESSRIEKEITDFNFVIYSLSLRLTVYRNMMIVMIGVKAIAFLLKTVKS